MMKLHKDLRSDHGVTILPRERSYKYATLNLDRAKTCEPHPAQPASSAGRSTTRPGNRANSNAATLKTYSRKRSYVDFSDDGDSSLKPLDGNIIVRAKTTQVQGKKPKLVQMRIDLGGQQTKQCKECGMSYVPFDEKDAAVHVKYHRSFASRKSLPAFVSGLDQIVWSGYEKALKNTHHYNACIYRIDRNSPLQARKLAWQVLQKAQEELGAVEITQHALWSLIERDKEMIDRFKVFLYGCGASGIQGLCLAEYAASAKVVLMRKSATTEDSSSVDVSEEAYTMSMGISRIWVERDQRGKGIATKMLECAREKFYDWAPIQKSQIAFSQPTESGLKLARNWFGRDHGWLLYDEL